MAKEEHKAELLDKYLQAACVKHIHEIKYNKIIYKVLYLWLNERMLIKQ